MSETTEPVRILHVDDEPDFLEITAEFLQRKNERFTVDVATSAADGLDRLTENAYDCIVSDYEMPGQDGIEFLKAVRKDHPDLPFVLFTAKGSETIASEAISAGVSEYLQKGSGTDQYTVLANRIENLVSRREAEITVARYDQRERESERYRRELLDITADPDTTTDEKAHQLLELGRERLGAENGHLVKIDEDRNRHEVISVTGSEIVQKGVTDLSKTYCRRTIDSDSIFDVHDAPGAGWEDDPAYQHFELGCYIGRKLLVESELFGTLCYVSSDPREEPFTKRREDVLRAARPVVHAIAGTETLSEPGGDGVRTRPGWDLPGRRQPRAAVSNPAGKSGVRGADRPLDRGHRREKPHRHLRR